jgi:Zn-finger nucleic acid-binding protein
LSFGQEWCMRSGWTHAPKCGGVWLDGGELQKLIAKIRKYREEYYSDKRYREWEEEWCEDKIFD